MKETGKLNTSIHKAEYLDVERGCRGEIFGTSGNVCILKKNICWQQTFSPATVLLAKF